MVSVWYNFDDEQEKMSLCFYGCEYSLVGLANIIGPDNTLISRKRNIVEKMLKNVVKEDITHNSENIIYVLLGWWNL